MIGIRTLLNLSKKGRYLNYSPFELISSRPTWLSKSKFAFSSDHNKNGKDGKNHEHENGDDHHAFSPK